MLSPRRGVEVTLLFSRNELDRFGNSSLVICEFGATEDIPGLSTNPECVMSANGSPWSTRLLESVIAASSSPAIFASSAISLSQVSVFSNSDFAFSISSSSASKNFVSSSSCIASSFSSVSCRLLSAPATLDSACKLLNSFRWCAGFIKAMSSSNNSRHISFESNPSESNWLK